MTQSKDSAVDTENELSLDKELQSRWDAAAYRILGTPYEALSIDALARSSGQPPMGRWLRGKGGKGSDFVGLSYAEVCAMKGMSRQRLLGLIDIFEATLQMDAEVNFLGSFNAIDDMAKTQRMRFVEQFGLYHDYPLRLANFDAATREMFHDEEVITLVDLMDFIDRMADKLMLSGELRRLQSIFAHGDEIGLTQYFPYRKGHRGFHFAEALAFCFERLSTREREAVLYYYERRGRNRLFSKRVDVPQVLVDRLLPDVMECLLYFGRRQPRLLSRICDAAELCRELMYLDRPETENLVQWCVQLVLGICCEDFHEVDEDLKRLNTQQDEHLVAEVASMMAQVGR